MQINLGRVLPVFRGEWNSTATYTKLDIVYYGGSSYVAKGVSTGKYPDSETTYWGIVSKGGSFDGLTENQIQDIARQLGTVTYQIGTNTYND